MTQPVSFPLAKLLKEKGFDILTYNYYEEEDYYYKEELITSKGALLENEDWPYNVFSKQLNAPTIAEVVMWLYEKHGIWITVTSISQESWQCHMTKKGDSLGNCYLEDFYTPTEAYEAGIEYALNNIKI